MQEPREDVHDDPTPHQAHGGGFGGPVPIHDEASGESDERAQEPSPFDEPVHDAGEEPPIVPTFGGTSPIDDPEAAKAAALRRARVEDHDNRGIEPVDDRVAAVERPDQGDRRGRRRGGRGRGGRDDRGPHDRPRGGRNERGGRPHDAPRGAPIDDLRAPARPPYPVQGFGGGMPEPMERGPMERGPIERAPMDRGPMERGPIERAPFERGPMERRPRGARPVPGPSYERGRYENPLVEREAGGMPGADVEVERPRVVAPKADDRIAALQREIEEMRGQSGERGGYGHAAPISAPVSNAPARGSAPVLAAQRVAMLADVPNLQRSAKRGHGRAVSFAKLFANVVRGRAAVRAIAFLAERDASDPAFLEHLRQNGFETRRVESRRGGPGDRGEGFRRSETAGALAVEALLLASRVDALIIASSDPDLAPLVDAVRAKGCRIEIAAFPDGGAESLAGTSDAFHPLGRDELYV